VTAPTETFPPLLLFEGRVPSKLFQDHIILVGSINDQERDILIRFLRRIERHDPIKEPDSKALQQELAKRTREDVASIVGVILFILKESVSLGLDRDQIDQDISRFPLPEAARGRLAEIVSGVFDLRERVFRDNRTKSTAQKTLATLRNAEFAYDLRVVHRRDRLIDDVHAEDDQVVSVEPVLIVELHVQDDDGETQRVRFQLAMDQFNRFLRILTRAEERLTRLRGMAEVVMTELKADTSAVRRTDP